jgi:hypothetical protein
MFTIHLSPWTYRFAGPGTVLLFITSIVTSRSSNGVLLRWRIWTYFRTNWRNSYHKVAKTQRGYVSCVHYWEEIISSKTLVISQSFLKGRYKVSLELKLLLCVRKVRSSSRGTETNYPERFSWGISEFPNVLQIASLPLYPMSFPVLIQRPTIETSVFQPRFRITSLGVTR